jgi:hypothetical protein
VNLDTSGEAMAGFVSVKLRKDRNILFNSNLAGFVSVKLEVYLAIHLGVAPNLYFLAAILLFWHQICFFLLLFVFLFYKSTKLEL